MNIKDTPKGLLDTVSAILLDILIGTFIKFLPERFLKWTLIDVERALIKKYGRVDKEAIEKLRKLMSHGNVVSSQK
jgi:hypothetical protein